MHLPVFLDQTIGDLSRKPLIALLDTLSIPQLTAMTSTLWQFLHSK
jgi:hypothetical protein